MSPGREELVEYYDGLSDEELQRRAAAFTLTDLAQAVAEAELAGRGLPLPVPPAPEVKPPPDLRYGEDFVVLGHYSDSIEAETVRACLESESIPTLLVRAGANWVDSALAPALNGARIEVPASYQAEARRLLASLQAGQLALDPVAEAPPDPAAHPDPLFAPDRRRLRVLVFHGFILIYATVGLLVPVMRSITRENNPDALVTPLWVFVLPMMYFIGTLLFVLSSKWSLPLLGLHLIASQALLWLAPQVYLLTSGFTGPLVTGMILFYGFRLLAQNKLR